MGNILSAVSSDPLPPAAKKRFRGARIVISEPDWETFVVDMPNKPLTRKILNHFCDETQNGWCGRELIRFFYINWVTQYLNYSTDISLN
jgi:hypothetical protein